MSTKKFQKNNLAEISIFSSYVYFFIDLFCRKVSLKRPILKFCEHQYFKPQQRVLWIILQPEFVLNCASNGYLKAFFFLKGQNRDKSVTEDCHIHVCLKCCSAAQHLRISGFSFIWFFCYEENIHAVCCVYFAPILHILVHHNHSMGLLLCWN